LLIKPPAAGLLTCNAIASDKRKQTI
jgi:hypothetical protein